MKRLIEKSPDRRDAFIQVLLSGCAMRRARGQGTATWLLVGMLLLGSTAQPADAGLWDEVKEWYVSFQLGEVDEASIPQVPVEYVGEVGLNYLSSIELDFGEDTPGIGSIYDMSTSPEGTLLIADMLVGKQVFEFSLTDGQYIRSFGRRGRGPGEYGRPSKVAVDPQGQVYVLDTTFGQILRYDRQGRYLDKTRLFKIRRLLTGRGGEVFLLQVNRMLIMEVQRLDPATWEQVYRTPVSTDNQRFISFRLASAHLCYSPARHRLYYLGPNDYLVKELDADTGEIIRQFGMRPEGFVPLPKRYHSIGRGSLADMEELSIPRKDGTASKTITTVSRMILIEDQYLLVWHGNPVPPATFALYDVTASTGIEAYSFDESALEYLKPFGMIAAGQDRLYIWRKPAAAVVEISNGTVEIYELSFAGIN